VLLLVEVNGYLEAYHRYNEGELLTKGGFVKDFQRLLRVLSNSRWLSKGKMKNP